MLKGNNKMMETAEHSEVRLVSDRERNNRNW